MALRHGRLTIAGALLALACLAAPAAQAAPRRAVLAFVPGATAAQLAALPGASVALLGATQGRYEQVQTLLDVSQGTRTSIPTGFC